LDQVGAPQAQIDAIISGLGAWGLSDQDGRAGSLFFLTKRPSARRQRLTQTRSAMVRLQIWHWRNLSGIGNTCVASEVEAKAEPKT